MVAPILPRCRLQTNNTLMSCSRTTQHHNVLHFIVIHNCDNRSSSLYQCGCVLYLQHSSCMYVDNLILFHIISDESYNPYVGYKKCDDVDDSYYF